MFSSDCDVVIMATLSTRSREVIPHVHSHSFLQTWVIRYLKALGQEEMWQVWQKLLLSYMPILVCTCTHCGPSFFLSTAVLYPDAPAKLWHTRSQLVLPNSFIFWNDNQVHNNNYVQRDKIYIIPEHSNGADSGKLTLVVVGCGDG